MERIKSEIGGKTRGKNLRKEQVWGNAIQYTATLVSRWSQFHCHFVEQQENQVYKMLLMVRQRLWWWLHKVCPKVSIYILSTSS